MREIKFRGKRIDNGEWVIGNLVICENGDYVIETGRKKYGYGGVSEKVDPETVGQYTGLKDINGLEIYKDDFCQIGTTVYQIVWMNMYAKYGAKVIQTETVLAKGCTFSLQDYVLSGKCNFEKIGTIHDNPSLVGESE